jgi:hypothetical protein
MLLVLNLLHGFGLLALLVIFYGTNNAVTALIIIFVFGYIGLQYTQKVKGNNKPVKLSEKVTISDYMMDRIWKYCNYVLFVAIAVVVVYYEYSHPEFTVFQAFSIWCIVFFLALGVIFVAMFLADRADFEEAPIYHSPWLLPIYKYDS